jgi:hypothetical protein
MCQPTSHIFQLKKRAPISSSLLNIPDKPPLASNPSVHCFMQIVHIYMHFKITCMHFNRFENPYKFQHSTIAELTRQSYFIMAYYMADLMNSAQCELVLNALAKLTCLTCIMHLSNNFEIMCICLKLDLR